MGIASLVLIIQGICMVGAAAFILRPPQLLRLNRVLQAT